MIARRIPLARLMTNDDDLFRSLYDEHYDRVVGFLVRMGVAREDAREIAQDAYMRVYSNMSSVRQPAALLYTTARNLALNRHRDAHTQKRNVVSVPLDDANPVAGTPTAEDRVIREEQRAQLAKAIGELPKGTRQALLLRLKGLSYKEIAEVLGISVNGVKSRIHDAKVRLREQLGDEPPGTGEPENDGDG
jgi:RNA polymerase sigma-70 factor (ECF subfamily)